MTKNELRYQLKAVERELEQIYWRKLQEHQLPAMVPALRERRDELRRLLGLH